MNPSPYANDQYTIGWISALNEEFMVAMAMLDEEHGRPQSTPQEDTNVYHLGRIGDHNVAMACLSGGQMGTGPAAIVAENMRRTFKSIRFALLVGVGGGVPGKGKDIRLGDVVVSYPSGTYTGVVQYDYGKLKGNGHIQRKDWFSAPPSKVLSAVNLLKTFHRRPKNPINNMLGFIDELGEEYAYPEASEALDRLYQADQGHVPEAETCDSCNTQALVPRKPRKSPSKPCVHYGIIASGNVVVKDGTEREKIDQRYENSILCFEMEAAGLMNNFPCLVVRGISDYSDSHKNDQWQNRAIAVSSAYAKELLSLIGPSDMEVLPPIAARVLDTVSRKLNDIDEHTTANTELLERTTKENRQKQDQDLQIKFEAWLKPPNVRETQQNQARKRLIGTCNWIWSNPMFLGWSEAPLLSAPDRILCIYGSPGSGKSILASAIVDRMWNDKVPALFFAFSSMHTSQQKSSGLIRSLLWQLVKIVLQEQNTSLLSTWMLRGQPTTSDLWMRLSEIATFASEPVYCIIDGIDESMDPIPELLQRFLDFLDTRSNFRFILLGRQHSFHKTDSIHHKIEIQPALTKDDVDRVIETEINQSAILNTPALRDKVLRSLQTQSDGNFLWVKLMFSHLEKSLPLAHGLKRLNKLPRDLESIYERLLLGLAKNLEEDELNLARKLFAFIVVSQRPLSIAEAQYLLAVDALSTSTDKRQSIQDCLVPQLDRRVLDLCGDLINIVNGCLQLVHFSVKEFLVRPKRQWPRRGKYGKIVEFRVPSEDAHHWFASACIEYLERCADGSPLHDWDNPPELERHHPFLRYSSTYMHTHMYQSGLPTHSSLNNVRNFVKSDRWIVWLEFLFISRIEDDSLYSQLEEFNKFVSWLGDKEDEILGRASASLELAHEKRAQAYGPNDSRTERLGLFLHYLRYIHVSPPVEAPDSCAVQSTDPSVNLQQIMQIVQQNEPLPLQLKADLLFRMIMHLQKVKRLTDPMKILFRKILQHASSMPVYVLLVVGEFYGKLNKYEQAIEFYLVALRKVEAKEVRVKFLILQLIGQMYSLLGQHEQALEKFEHAMAGREQIYGPEHEQTLVSVLWVGGMLQNLNQHRTSLEFLQKALAGFEKMFGPEHTRTLDVIDIMCDAYGALNRYSDSLDLHKKALIARDKTLGPEHQDTLSNLHDIGYVYNKLGQYPESLEFFHKALTGREKTLGPEHENTLLCLYNIGAVYDNLGQYTESLEFFHKALTGREKTLGPEHENTLLCLYNIGMVYEKLGQYTESLEFFHKALAGYEKTLGPEHKDTLSNLHNIGWVYNNLGQYTESLEFFHKALAGHEKKLGSEHENTLLCLHNIGMVYDKLGQYTESLECFHKALAGREKTLGSEHEHTLLCLYNIGMVYEKLGQYTESLELFHKALAGYEKALGPEHSDTLRTIDTICGVYEYLNQYSDSLELRKKALIAQEKTLGAGHEETLHTAPF